MEPLFSNSCKYTKEYLEEMAEATMPAWYKLYCIIFSALFIVFAGIVTFVFKQYIVGVLFVVFAIALVVIFKKSPQTSAKRSYAQNMKAFGGELETKVFFYEDSIVGKNIKTGGVVSTKYDEIESVKETENLYVIDMGKNMVIIIDKDGFVSDNRADFPAFIKSKSVNAKMNF